MQLSCLLVQQPYASLIVSGKKRWEFRSYEVKKRGLIGIAASPSSILKTNNQFLNNISSNFPKGKLLGLANLKNCFYLTSKGLAKAYGSTVDIKINNHILTTLDEPIGEPIEDVNSAISNKKWASWVWEFDDVQPLNSDIKIRKTSKSTWVLIDYTDE